MTTTRTKTACAFLLTLGLSACAGSASERGSAPPASRERAAYGGDSAGAEAVSVQADESESYDDAVPQRPQPTYEPGPTTTGASMPQPSPPPRTPGQMLPETSDGMGGELMIDVGPRFDRLLSLQSDLGGVLALSTPNCPRAHDLEEAICELSEHICTIADDNPDAREARSRCRDGRDRCERAREQVGEGCGE